MLKFGISKAFANKDLFILSRCKQELKLFYSTNESKCNVKAPNFKFITSVCSIPKNEKIPTRDKATSCTPLDCGEDSYFLSDNENELVLGVADGVGSWRNSGINPALFSQTLMSHASELATTPTAGNDPKTLLYESFMKLIEDFKSGKKKPFGSSTACIVMINKMTRKLRFGNLGDSGFMILSPNKEGNYRIKFKSESQQHFFNCPYQITLAPDEGLVRDQTNLIATNDDDNLLKKKFILKDRDLVLVMTDGIIDNIYDKELEELITNSIATHSISNPKSIVQDLAFKAYELSLDKERTSPFTIEAKKHKCDFPGGKQDDITVVAVFVEKIKNKKT